MDESQMRESQKEESLKIVNRQHEQYFKYYTDFKKRIISLAGGIIILSITFLNNIAPQRMWLEVIILGWICLVISIIFGIWSQTKALRDHREVTWEYYLSIMKDDTSAGKLHVPKSELEWHFYRLMLLFFFIGLILVVIFAIRNVLI
jgi:uncharacterized membrane protein